MKTTNLPFVSLCLTFGFVFGNVLTDKGCGNDPVDVVFVLDESSSIWPPDFKRQLAFVNNITKVLDVGPDRTRVGVLVFSVKNSIIFQLGDYRDEEDLNRKISGIIQRPANTRTDLALKRLREEMFSTQNSRPNVPHVAIVITDGESDFFNKTKDEAKLCRDDKIQIYAIGVGKKTSPKELDEIAGHRNRVFTIDNYKALETLLPDLNRMECTTSTTPSAPPKTPPAPPTTPSAPPKTPPAPPTTPPAPPKTPPAPPTTTREPSIHGCGSDPADVIFVLDDSRSIYGRNFNTQMVFVNTIVSTLDVGRNRTKVGVLVFSTEIRIICQLGDYKDVEDLKSKITAINQTNGDATRTDLALKRLREEMFSTQHSRPNVPHLAIVITDGNSTYYDKTKDEAQLCRSENIQMYVVGVGEVSMEELENIAGHRDHVFAIDKYEALESFLPKVNCNQPLALTDDQHRTNATNASDGERLLRAILRRN